MNQRRLAQTIATLVTITFSLALQNSTRAEEAFEVQRDIVYGHKAGMALTYDMIKNKERANEAAVVFVMSGGWFSAWMPPERIVSKYSPHGFKHFRELVDDGYALFVVRHGSAPYFKVPDAVADVRRAIRHIRLHSNTYGIDSNRIGVTGGSAGGHLSLMLGTAADEGQDNAGNDVDQTSNRVAAVVAYFPPVDLRQMVGPNKQFPALDFDKNDAGDVSPLLHVSPDDAPTLLIHGDQDRLVKLDHSQRMLAALQQAEVTSDLLVIENAGHGFAGEHGRRASQALIDWFDEHLLDESPAAPVAEQPLLADQPRVEQQRAEPAAEESIGQ